MTTQDFAREKVLVDIISERDAVIISLISERDKLTQENQQLSRDLENMKKKTGKEDK